MAVTHAHSHGVSRPNLGDVSDDGMPIGCVCCRVAALQDLERRECLQRVMPTVAPGRGRLEEAHAHTLESASDLEAPFYPLVAPLLRAAWRKKRLLRLVSVKFSGVEDGPAQLEMFAQSDEKRRRLAGVLDKLNSRTSLVQHGHQLAKGSKGVRD